MAGKMQAAGRAPIEREKWGTSLGGVKIGGRDMMINQSKRRE